MEKVFQKRRSQFLQQTARYLRYVFNDHFVLVLLFLLGFLVVQYTNFINHFPKTSRLPLVLVLLVTFFFSFIGKVATYLQEADRIFLLPQESFLRQHLTNATHRSYLIWGSIQVVFTLLFTPIFLLSGWQPWHLVLYIVVLLGVRALWLQRQKKRAYLGGLLDLEQLIHDEKTRQQNILIFFSLFTGVKGLSATTKPRGYLTPFITLISFTKESSVWFGLFVRAYLRNGDYFWLSVRLMLLALGLGLIMPNWWGIAVVALLDYLLLFQLLGLYRVYDYQVMTQLYPLKKELKLADFRVFLQRLSIIITGIQLLLVIVEWRFIIILPVMVLLNWVYLPSKLKKFVD